MNHFLSFVTLLALALPAAGQSPRKTHVTIRGDMFLINNEPTYKGRTWNGHRIEGLLFNARLVQGIFDDLNQTTRNNWAYPDTRKWDVHRGQRQCNAEVGHPCHSVVDDKIHWAFLGDGDRPAIFDQSDDRLFSCVRLLTGYGVSIVPGIRLKQAEIDAAFSNDELRAQFKPILNTKTFAAMLGRPVKTVRAWLARGRFKNAAIKRGKEYSIWRDRAILLWFNGSDWRENDD